MAHKRPLFVGDSEIDQIFKIFSILGTPNNNTWPGIDQLPDYKPTFPKWNQSKLKELTPNLCDKGRDLLSKMLVYNPADRITAKDALNHPYFDDLDKKAIEELK